MHTLAFILSCHMLPPYRDEYNKYVHAHLFARRHAVWKYTQSTCKIKKLNACIYEPQQDFHCLTTRSQHLPN